MKTGEFSRRPFDQTRRFSISEFSVWGMGAKTKPRSWKNSEFDQNAIRLVFVAENDLDHSIIARSSYSYTI